MTIKTGKYRGFHIIKERDKQERTIIHTVFWKYIPVARFDSGSVNERKLAAIDLVEPKLSGFEIEPHFMMQNILLKQQF